MKRILVLKLSLFAIIFFQISLGCEKEDNKYSMLEGQSSILQQLDGDILPEDIFDFYFSQNFESNKLGIYNDSEWQKDWNYPDWSNRQIPPKIISETNLSTSGSQFMNWNFPKGSVGPSEGGGQWLTKFGDNLKEVYLSYNIRFKSGFDWVLSGKIPGLRGGPIWNGAGPPDWDEGFVALLMWNKEGILKFYYYHHDQTHDYGDMKAWDHVIETGKWFNVTVRIVINTISDKGGNNDGIMEGFIDGTLIAQVTGLKLRNVSNITVDQIFMTSSFGGSGDEFAANREEWIDIDDVAVFNYKENIKVTRDNVPNSAGTRLLLPYPACKEK
jgi:hypothetical protein